MSDGRLFDEGLQPERTLLAWQRTCLAVAVGVVVGARLTLPMLGSLAIALGFLGLVLVAFALLSARRRYRRANRDLVGREVALSQDGTPITPVATGAAVFAAAGAIFVVMHALSR